MMFHPGGHKRDEKSAELILSSSFESPMTYNHGILDEHHIDAQEIVGVAVDHGDHC